MRERIADEPPDRHDCAGGSSAHAQEAAAAAAVPAARAPNRFSDLPQEDPEEAMKDWVPPHMRNPGEHALSLHAERHSQWDG